MVFWTRAGKTGFRFTNAYLIEQPHLLPIFLEQYDIGRQSLFHLVSVLGAFPFLAMAGQRTGRSRFGFKMVLVAVVCCALHLTDLNGYRTLAVPSAGAPNRAELQDMKKSELKEKLREQGLKVSGLKADLIERLMQPWKKLNIPEGEEPANSVTDVFFPVEGTIQKLEELLEEERVVWIRAGVAAGKSTLAKHLSMTWPSKYLPVNHPKREKAASWESWENELRKTWLKETSTADVANGDLDDAFERFYDSDQVLIFDDCHLLFSCPTLSQLLLEPPKFRHRRVKVLMLSTAEAEEPQGKFWTTPRQVTAKYMWTPPIPLPSQLVDQLAAADVYLTEAAIDFFMRFCGGHRNIFMRSMQWVQTMQKKEKKSARWDVRRTLREVKQSCDNGNWTNAATSDLLGMLVQSCAIRGKCKDATSIPKEFVDILCQGASWLELPVCRDLTRHGFVLPNNKKHQEFEPYNWDLFGARYVVSNPLLAAYYRELLQKTRQLKVDVDKEVTSCIDLLLRALPYLNFAEVVAVKVQNKKVQYTRAIIRMLQSLGFGNVAALEDGANGNVDIYFLQGFSTTFAIEVVMAKQSLRDIAEHRSRFDNRSKPNYQKAVKKCLVIIGKLDRVQTCVREVQGGIEVVGLAPNEGCVGYTVCVKGEGVVEFDIECDGVAKKLTSLNKTPYFEVAQKLQSIAPGWVALKQMWPEGFLWFFLESVMTCHDN